MKLFLSLVEMRIWEGCRGDHTTLLGKRQL